MVSAWSIGTGKRKNMVSGENQPGPGAYLNVIGKQKKIPPQWRFGTGNRSKLSESKTPGPGTYQLKPRLTYDSSKYTIRPKLSKTMENWTPGPGTYQPKNDSRVKKPPSWNMGLKSESAERRFGPGPGNYETKSTVQNVPCMRFPNSPRPDLGSSDNKTPGPGTYKNINRPSTAAPRYGIGTSQRDGLRTQGPPGPGEYEFKNSINLSQNCTMQGKKDYNEQREASKVPGPGSYTPNFFVKMQNPQYRIGTGQRNGLGGDSKTPGPGTYTARMSCRPSSPQYKIGTDNRRPLQGEGLKTPGPGSYQHKSTNYGPQLSFKGVQSLDPQEKQKLKMPGPGQYTPTENYTKERPQSAKIGTSLRQPLSGGGKQAPGPGRYNLGNDPNKFGPKYGFGTSQRPQSSNRANDPGPGTYNLLSMIADVPKYLMPNKPNSLYTTY